MSNTLKLGLIQHACGPKKEANIATAVDLMRQAAGKGATLLVTQELFASQYFCQTENATNFELAETIPGPTSQRLSELAKELGVFVSGSIFEKRTAGVFHNTSIMIDPAGKIIDRYRKMHIPDDPRFYEKFYFTPGDLGFRTQQLDGVRTGMLVCWDQWFPEAARLTALRGAQVLLYPTAIAWWDAPGKGETPEDRKQQIEAWQTIQRSHAIANGVFVVAVNRIGREDELLFWGNSFVANPGGVVIGEGPRDQPAAIVVELDLNRIDELRQGWPFLRDRRIDAYDKLTYRFLDAHE